MACGISFRWETGLGVLLLMAGEIFMLIGLVGWNYTFWGYW